MTTLSEKRSGSSHAPLILDGTKLSWHADRLNAWLRGERIAPVTIDCALTTDCTYRCTYCYGQLQRMRTGSLPKDVIMSFLDDAAAIGVKAVSFVSDGESTCSPHLYEAIRHGKGNGLDMALGTNGYLLKDDELEATLPCLTYLRFNISSGNPEGYSRIHGVSEKCWRKVVKTIRLAVAAKRARNLPVTIGLQMVLMPQFAEEIMPLVRLGRELGVDYLVIKHCSDDEHGSLGVDYAGYAELGSRLREAEACSTPEYTVSVKWSKIMSGGQRSYSACMGPPFILQMSGSGLVAPCGMLFNDRYKEFHIGSLRDMTFRQIWESERYWEVMKRLTADAFDARTDCGTLCLQHKVNELLWDLRQKGVDHVPRPEEDAPDHINFV